MTSVGRHTVLFVAFCLLAWAVVAPSGVAPILGFQHDEEAAESSFVGVGDLSAEVQPVTLAPETVTKNGSGTVTVELAVRAAADVNTSEFTLSVASTDRAIPAADVTCGRNCTLTVPERTVAGLVDSPGEYELVVTGWWSYDRQFAAKVGVTVLAADSAGVGTPTADTATPTATENGTPNSSTATNASTATPTPTPTNSSTATPPPTDSATPTSTPTNTSTPTPSPISSPTPTPTNTSTPTPSPTPSSTPTPTNTATPTPSPTPTPTNTTSEPAAWIDPPRDHGDHEFELAGGPSGR